MDKKKPPNLRNGDCCEHCLHGRYAGYRDVVYCSLHNNSQTITTNLCDDFIKVHLTKIGK